MAPNPDDKVIPIGNKFALTPRDPVTSAVEQENARIKPAHCLNCGSVIPDDGTLSPVCPLCGIVYGDTIYLCVKCGRSFVDYAIDPNPAHLCPACDTLGL